MTEHYGKKLARFREATGLTQIDVANKLGVRQGTVSNHEKAGDYPPQNYLEQYCKLYKITIWQFFKPDDVVVPDLNPLFQEWNTVFSALPEKVQNHALAMFRQLVEMMDELT